MLRLQVRDSITREAFFFSGSSPVYPRESILPPRGGVHDRHKDLTLLSVPDDFGAFLSGINPYLAEHTVRGLISAHGTHHVLQINQYKKKDYAHLEETWKMMRAHIYVIADTLTEALIKQFPGKFS